MHARVARSRTAAAPPIAGWAMESGTRITTESARARSERLIRTSLCTIAVRRLGLDIGSGCEERAARKR
jgi:hypothetical protein